MSSSRDLSEEILITLREIIHSVDLHSRAVAQRCGLTGPQLVVLNALSKKDHTPVGRVADRVSLSHATLTGILDRLEDRNYVTKEIDEIDRRRVLVTITDKGRKMTQEAPPVLQEEFAAQLEELPEWEQTLILAILQRLASMMNPAAGNGSMELPVDSLT